MTHCKHYESYMIHNESDKPGGVCHHPVSGVWEVPDGCGCPLFFCQTAKKGSPVEKEGVGEGIGTETGDIVDCGGGE
jgi:hypothetical protein